MKKQSRTILFAAGGTGGHVYPAIAIADAVREMRPDYNIHFVGTKNHMEWEAVPKAGYEISNIWISGFQRRFTFKNMLFPFKLMVSLFQSSRIIRKHAPSALVACGGYVAGPVGYVAARRNVRVYLQEQNSFPGVTNRMLAKFATRIYTAFKDASNFFPNHEVELKGNPTRKSLLEANPSVSKKSFHFDEERPVLLILGGSLGAESINKAVLEHLGTLHDVFGYQIIWQCGKRYEEWLRKEIDPQFTQNLRLKPYLNNMDEAYAAADLVISRAGASSCSELMLTGKPSILVPSPNVAGDHQTKNAQSMVDAGAARMLRDQELKAQLAQTVHSVMSNESILREMSESARNLAKPNAAKEIATEIIADIEQELDQPTTNRVA